MAHLRLHTGLSDDGAAAAVDDAAAAIEHVAAVAEADVAGSRERIRRLCHRHALAGQGGLLGAQARALEHARISRHGVARLEHEHITRDQLLTGDGDELPAAQDAAVRGAQFLQGGDGLLGLALLVHAEHRVDDDDDENDDDIGKALVRIRARDGRDQRRREQHEDHRIGQLLEKALHERWFRRFGKHIAPVARKARGGLLWCETVGRAVECVQGVRWWLPVVFHGFVLLQVSDTVFPKMKKRLICLSADKSHHFRPGQILRIGCWLGRAKVRANYSLIGLHCMRCRAGKQAKSAHGAAF